MHCVTKVTKHLAYDIWKQQRKINGEPQLFTWFD